MADRNYGSSFNQQKASPSFNYVWDETLNSGSGAWTPALPSAGGGGGSTDMTASNRILVSGAKSEAACSVICSDSFVSGFQGKAGAGEFHGVFGYNSGIAQFLHMYNGTSEAGTRIGVIAVGAANNFSADFSAHGVIVSAGIFVAFSTSPISHVPSDNDGIVTISFK